MSPTTLLKQYKTAVKEKNELKKRLTKLEKDLELMGEYAKHVVDIKEARKEIKRGKTISQDKLFKKLGI